MNLPRPVIILFVIVIVLFACGVCSGATLQANRPIDLDVGWVKSLGNTFARPQALPRQEIRVASGSPASCLQGNVLVVGLNATCRYTLDSSRTPVRRMTLRLATNSTVQAVLTQPDVLTARETLTGAGSTQELDVYREGGTLSLTCQGATNPCRVELRQTDIQ